MSPQRAQEEKPHHVKNFERCASNTKIGTSQISLSLRTITTRRRRFATLLAVPYHTIVLITFRSTSLLALLTSSQYFNISTKKKKNNDDMPNKTAEMESSTSKFFWFRIASGIPFNHPRSHVPNVQNRSLLGRMLLDAHSQNRP